MGGGDFSLSVTIFEPPAVTISTGTFDARLELYGVAIRTSYLPDAGSRASNRAIDRPSPVFPSCRYSSPTKAFPARLGSQEPVSFAALSSTTTPGILPGSNAAVGLIAAGAS